MMKRAILSGLLKVKTYNPRDYTTDKHHTVDDRPFGGGPGMVLKAEPYLKAFAQARGTKKSVKTIMLSPRGKTFTKDLAREYASDFEHIIFLCGHYEGIDARVAEILMTDETNHYEEISIGNFVLTGGELAALTMTDAIARFVPGVLGNPESNEEGRVAAKAVYTRPAEFSYKKKQYAVPDVLLSGSHAEIEKWREQSS